MGAGAITHAVADAGPLIHLTEVGCLSLLRIFDCLSIPDAVWAEAVTRRGTQSVQRKLPFSRSLRTSGPPNRKGCLRCCLLGSICTPVCRSSFHST
jgi:hypothetical protein